MIITKRSNEEKTTYSQNGSSVGLLERKVDSTYVPHEENVSTDVDYEAEKVRRQRNLQKILNYDNESAMLKIQEEEKQETVDSTVDFAPPKENQDEDIRPTSTTMQFGDIDDGIRNEMNAQAGEVKAQKHMSSKDKFIITIYSLCLAVVFALIVLNTGVIASLTENSATKQQQLQEITAKYNSIVTEIDAISNDEYVVNVAQNVYGMIEK